MSESIVMLWLVLACCSPVICLANGPIELMCFEQAGYEYNIAPDLLKAIAMVESNFQINAVNTKNRNGSIDVCHMLFAQRLRGYKKELIK